MCSCVIQTESKPSAQELDDEEGPPHNRWRFDVAGFLNLAASRPETI